MTLINTFRLVLAADESYLRAAYWQRVRPLFQAHRRVQLWRVFFDTLAPGLGSFIYFFGPL